MGSDSAGHAFHNGPQEQQPTHGIGFFVVILHSLVVLLAECLQLETIIFLFCPGKFICISVG